MIINHLITTICRGGAENQLLILCREQIATGKTVNVIFLKGSPELYSDFISSGVNVIGNFSNMNPVTQVYKLKKYLSGTKNILHCHLPRAELIGALARKNNILILSKHNSEPFFPGSPPWVSRVLARFVAKRAVACIAISNAVKDYLLLNKETVDSLELQVIHYGFDKLFELDQRIKSELVDKLPMGYPIIGTVGRLAAQKDYPSLLNAFSLFINSFPDAQLIIIGSGPDESNIRKLVVQLGISEHVHFKGKTNHVREWMSAFDVFVLSSIYEGFGLVLLEAMQAEAPIIAARNSAIPEVLGESYLGLFTTSDVLELEKKLLEFSSHETREESKMALVGRLKLFRPEVMENRINSLYVKSISIMN